MSHFTIAYSSCPNDTFIFHALANRLINTHGFDFKITMADVETLNQQAADSSFDITKLSFATFGELRDRYALLRTGAALGRGCGPLVVCQSGKTMSDRSELAMKKPITAKSTIETEIIQSAPRKPVVAVPGRGTTAFVLFMLFIKEKFPDLEPEIIPMPFEKIMPAIRDGVVDFGLVIHEGRFIYHSMGLESLVDLGAWWERHTSLPIPLGCIAIKREIYQKDLNVASSIQSMIGQSIQYAFDHPESSRAYIKTHAQELDDEVIDQHINLYVNHFSKDIGAEGEAAICKFFQKAQEAGVMKPGSQTLFACK